MTRSASPASTRRLIAHAALVVAGLAALVWALTLAADPVLMCRDQVMTPGTTCSNAQGTATQTYEERLATWRAARPVVGVGGVLVAGFGVVLVRGELRRGELRRAGSSGRTRPGRPPAA